MRFAIVIVLAGCGRVAFEPLREVDPDAALPDASGTLGMPVEQTALNSNSQEFGTTISADGLELYYSTRRSGNADIYRATRPSRDVVFDNPTRIAALSDDSLEDGEPTLSHDGLTLYFNRGFPDKVLYSSTRSSTTVVTWSAPTPIGGALAGFSSADFGGGDQRLVVANQGELYESVRSGGGWAAPVSLGIAKFADVPAISSDDLDIYFESGNPVAVWHAHRDSVAKPFGAPEQLAFGEPFDSAGVGDPDLTDDGNTFVIVIDRPPNMYDVFLVDRQ